LLQRNFCLKAVSGSETKRSCYNIAATWGSEAELDMLVGKSSKKEGWLEHTVGLARLPPVGMKSLA
jgi:hypothetical protein